MPVTQSIFSACPLRGPPPLSPFRTPKVPGAEELVVRVVSSVEKRLDTKPRFAKVFADSDYPKEFPYKSKVSE